MKRHTMSAVLLAFGLGLGSVVAAPAAVAAPARCQYVAQDLPLPSGATGAEAVASNTTNSLILGQTQTGKGPSGVIWRDGKVSLVLSIPGDNFVIPRGINKNSVVVGNLQAWSGTNSAFRWMIGRYIKLATPEGHGSIAHAVNDHGDAVGVIYPLSSPETRTPVVWEANKPGYTQLLARGDAIAVSPDRKVLTDKGELHDITTGVSVFLDGRSPFVLDNQRIFGWGFTSIPEWDTRGYFVTTYDKGVEALGVNNHNTLFGGFGPSTIMPGLWSNGEWTAIQADKLPRTWGYGDITDDGVLIGNYRTDQGDRAARWICAA